MKILKINIAKYKIRFLILSYTYNLLFKIPKSMTSFLPGSTKTYFFTIGSEANFDIPFAFFAN